MEEISRNHRMNRILVIGCSGAGKTTLALELGRRLGCPVHHLDRLWWKPGWVTRAREEFDAMLDELLHQERWIIDGNYNRTLSRRLGYADTVILLDYPPARCLWGALRRWFRFRGQDRPDCGSGCPERFDLGFLRYIWSFNRVMKPKIENALDCDGQHCRVVRLRTPAATAEFLENLN